MFNKSIHHHIEAPAYPQTVTVHEAPAAATARLLRDLEKEAEKRVIGRWKAGPNGMDWHMTVYRNVKKQALTAVVDLQVNGKAIGFEFDVTRIELDNMAQEGLRLVRKRVAEMIAADLVIDVADKVLTFRCSPNVGSVEGTSR